MLNFNWWVNRKDPEGRNVFAGGFLGLDNIGVFDRSAPLPTGGYLDQADGTAWMAFYCQSMIEIALILSRGGLRYTKRWRSASSSTSSGSPTPWIASARTTTRCGTSEDGFFYDLLHLPNGDAMRLKVRSMVGLLPLCAATVFEPPAARFSQAERADRDCFASAIPNCCARLLQPTRRSSATQGGGWPRSVNKEKLKRILAYLLDENEFLSPHGIRSLSRYHEDHPFVFQPTGRNTACGYLPADSNTGMFGGNSNWRGPIWMPVNIAADSRTAEHVSVLRRRLSRWNVRPGPAST